MFAYIYAATAHVPTPTFIPMNVCTNTYTITYLRTRTHRNLHSHACYPPAYKLPAASLWQAFRVTKMFFQMLSAEGDHTVLAVCS